MHTELHSGLHYMSDGKYFRLLSVDKSEIVNDIQFSSGLGASDHLAYSVYLQCDPEIRDSETLKYNFIKVTMFQLIRNFNQWNGGNYTI